MLFSSMLFLWAFLPFVFLVYRFIQTKYQNLFLLAASLFFYAWGEPKYILLMLASIFIHYWFGLWISRARSDVRRKLLLAACAAVSLGLLGYFKYFNFILEILNGFAGNAVFQPRDIVLPIGISFYTFQALSYVVDIYRGEAEAQSDIFKLALYISFFPQLIAGPIVKYHDVAEQISSREISAEKTALGIRRFIFGLGKKVIISNTVAVVVDNIFVMPASQLSASLAWVGALLYALQIYFDFSGYSDMAIGLGKMFGFDFHENFNYPYIAQSVQDFWRRWHISMSTWFKEYLYIPLGGNRKGTARTYFNLLAVFAATGLWHGASFNFILWGLYHGFFLILERAFLGKLLKRNPVKIINHLYTTLVVLFGWVLFRAPGLREAAVYLKSMLGISRPPVQVWNMAEILDAKTILISVVGILLCGILQKLLPCLTRTARRVRFFEAVGMAFAFGVLTYSIVLLTSGTYNPFIYFRF